MELRHIPFNRLSIAAVNMRHGRKPPDVSDILPSIKARGILVPLLVRPAGRAYEIVAGRRRYYAAQKVRKERGRVAPLPCAVMAPGDDAAALEASLIENIHRLDPDAMAQYETFAKLTGEGRSVAQIAATFGLRDSVVRQRLALGNLVPAIRDAYRNDEIDDETLRYLTLASPSQQKDWLTLFQDSGSHAPRGYQLKQWLFGGQSISTKVAIFPLEQYSGQIVTDLFEEEGYFADADLFWELQNKAIAATRDGFAANGWPVEVLEIGKGFHAWEHVKTPKKKGGRVYIAVSHHGEVDLHEGYLPLKEARRAAKTGTKEGNEGAGSEPAATGRAAMSKPLQNYLDLHRHAAVRLALIAQPRVAYRLLVAHALAASGHWQVKAEPQQARTESIAASLTESPAQQAFAAERAAVVALLALSDDPEAGVRSNGDDHRTAMVFARLLALSDKEVQRVAACAMAETLAAGSAAVEAAGVQLKVDPRAHWTPDAAFFDLIRDKATVNAMLADTAGKAVADANVAERGTTQKQIIRDCLAGTNGRAKVEGWLPGLLAFPFRDGGGGPSPLAETAGRIAGLFPVG